MEILRQVGQFKLNRGSLMAKDLYNVTNSILVANTQNEGVSYWFGKETKDLLMLCSDEDFVHRAKQLAGNNINSLEVAKSYWDKLGDIPVNEDDDLEEDFEVLNTVFEKGTDKFEVWSWFEDIFNISVVKDLMNLK